MKIRGEQAELEEEREGLETTLGSKQRMKTLVKNELLEDAEKYGDERRSQLNEQEAAQALKEEDLVPSEPCTVVLSKSGWVRAAKGHEIDATTLNYKAGDEFRHAAHGRSNQQAVFLDSTGRAYSLPAHSLPSARSLGEPLTSRFTPVRWRAFPVRPCRREYPEARIGQFVRLWFCDGNSQSAQQDEGRQGHVSLPGDAHPVAPAVIARDDETRSSVPLPMVTCWLSRCPICRN